MPANIRVCFQSSKLLGKFYLDDLYSLCDLTTTYSKGGTAKVMNLKAYKLGM